MESQINLRFLKSDDLPAADELRQAAGWNQTLTDWRRLPALDPEGCFVAVDKDQVVGTATTTSFGDDLAWIGMVLVDPMRRNQGIGRLLLNHCLDYLRRKGVSCIKLDATPAGQILYEKLGFQVEWAMTRWMRTEPAKPDMVWPNRDAISTAANDLNDIFELDRHAFGVDRANLLQLLQKDSAQSVVYRGADGGLDGFGFLRDGINADYIGPVVAKTEEAGKAIIHCILRASQRPVYWDIPGPCTSAATWAAQLGFVHQRPLLRMYLGKNDAPGNPSQLWAISDPATG